MFGITRSQRDKLQDRCGLYLGSDALLLYCRRQCRQGDGHTVLHRHLSHIGIRPNLKCHRQRIASVIR